ncbi:MAG: hypothetical protein PHV55_05765 [Candidatus Omnitrophica bacterium]|nr:hypothetical protein [Candidatus Omnitrophota bacterium]
MDIKLITTQKVLSPTQISLADYVINPYRGCEFGCSYCYAQENKNLKNGKFCGCLGVKINAPAMLEKELRYTRPARVLLGSTTECFQYQESKYKITEQILSILNSFGVPCTILTKSHLIKKCLRLIAQNKENKIYFTFNVSRDAAVSALEKRSPSIQERLDTIAMILAHGIDLRIHMGPFIPHISNLAEIIALLPNGTTKIEVELYHKAMGNFSTLLKKVEENFGAALKEKIETVYAAKEDYLRYAHTLKEEIERIKKESGLTFFYVVPEFNAFYSPNVNYETPL